MTVPFLLGMVAGFAAAMVLGALGTYMAARLRAKVMKHGFEEIAREIERKGIVIPGSNGKNRSDVN
jgi:hypothetical protein